MNLPFGLILTVCIAAPDSQEIGAQVCGRNCLALALTFMGDEVSPEELAQHLPDHNAPFSVHDLESAAASLGFETLAAKWSSTADAAFPAVGILHVRKAGAPKADHFVLCFGATGSRLCIADYPMPAQMVERAQLARGWEGTVLYVAPKGSWSLTILWAKMWLVPVIWVLLGLSAVAIYLSSLRRHSAPSGTKPCTTST